jgi:dihydroorotase-like cyclic amidohydrolase
MSPEEIIEKFTSGPEGILGLPAQSVSEGAHVSVFNPESNTEFTYATWMSKSKNSPVIGMSLRGEVY